MSYVSCPKGHRKFMAELRTNPDLQTFHLTICPSVLLNFSVFFLKATPPTSAPLLCSEEVDGTLTLLAALCQLSLPLGMCCRFHGNRIMNLFPRKCLQTAFILFCCCF